MTGLLLLTSHEQAAPSWLPYVFLAIPAVIVLLVLRWALPMRRRYKQAQRSPLAQRREGVPLGSAAAIADAGAVPWQNLLEALAVQPESHGPAADGSPWDEGWGAKMLGLRSRVPLNTTGFTEPVVYWGLREARQVFIRLGVDEKTEGGELYSNRSLRECTVVRADLPSFRLRGDGGRVTADGGGVPLDVQRVIDGLAGSGGTGDDPALVADVLRQLPPRWFLVRNANASGGNVLLQPRWAMSFLRGPMTRTEIRMARGVGDAGGGGAELMERVPMSSRSRVPRAS